MEAIRVLSSPTLRLHEALPRPRHFDTPFPFNRDSLRYFYLARNGIYALARMGNLAGQEILFPAYFHGIEAEALKAAGVKLRFYPVHANMNVDANEIKARVTPQTKAIYLIHYLGFPGPVVALSRFCRARGMLLIEDCALALLSRLGDRPLGSYGDAAVFCLYKTLPLPNGGALLMQLPGAAEWRQTERPSLNSTMAYTATAIWRHLQFQTGGPVHKMLRMARSLARAMSGSLGVVPVGNPVFDRAKANLGMSRICRWVLNGQDFPSVIERRRRNYTYLLGRLKEISPPVLGELPDGVCPLFYPLRTGNKAAVMKRLLERGVEPIDFWSRDSADIPAGEFPEAEALRRTIVELPCHQDLNAEAMEWIVDRVGESRAEL